MKKAILLAILFANLSMAQVGIGTTTPDASASLDITSIDSGILIPRMTEMQRTMIGTPATGLLVYQTDNTSGFWFFNGSNWIILDATPSWNLDGNSGTNATTNFIGTTDDTDLIFKRNNVQSGLIGSSNIAMGSNALTSLTTGEGNSSFGNESLASNTEGSNNTAVGINTLSNNTTGTENSALGRNALQSTTTGRQNSAMGAQALTSTSTGFNNTAVGYSSLRFNSTGAFNTAVGNRSLQNSTTGGSNTAVGNSAMIFSTTGSLNSAFGTRALESNSTGSSNVAIGADAMNTNTTGFQNTAIGVNVMYDNISGQENTAVGRSALPRNTTGDDNTAIGLAALLGTTTGSQNTGVGREAGNIVTTGSNNTSIGYFANVPSGTASNQVRIGNTDVTYAGIQVAWTITSDRHWKSKVEKLPYGIDMLMAMKPVYYTRKGSENLGREMGFIAQDIEQTLNDFNYQDQGFLTKDDTGHLGIRYNDFISLLVKGVQEQQSIIENQQTDIDELKNMVVRLESKLAQQDN